ncbi:MAG: hypothetical protein PHE17_18480 [Thiothrix sp.]|uniref:hypothetical protein n=1 Tax=Thiothrix sp. TaxID=1032 RepID=UPI00260F9521|nr:hypothetical protein [Thiothrix sp.]MDD5395010.1 hypothetical protein [Thiothrix sp.]
MKWATFLRIFTSLALVGMASTGWGVAAGGEPPAASTARGRHPPTFFMMEVVNGEDKAAGLAPEDMEKDWQAKTLSQDPLRVTAELVTRYSEKDNGGRKCARVKGGIGQDLVPLKGKTYKDCADDKGGDTCKPFYVWSELDVCDDGMPPSANYEKYKADAADKDWKPPVTAIKGDK